MLRYFVMLFLALIVGLAHANEKDDADDAWAIGKPWPAHWGNLQDSAFTNWNVVNTGYVNKVYGEGEAAGTWLKDIPSAMQAGAAVELCLAKKGVFSWPTKCQAALVDPALVGKLKKDDAVAWFGPHHSLTAFSSGPGAHPEQAIRVFQKYADAEEKECWKLNMLVLKAPNVESCLARIDKNLIEQLLTRDFGPRDGAQ